MRDRHRAVESDRAGSRDRIDYTYDVLGTPSRGRHSNPNGQLIGLLALICIV